MKQVREVREVLAEMRANHEFERLGVPEPSVEAVEELLRGMQQTEAEIKARQPAAWDTMTQDERDEWFVQEGLMTIEQPEPLPDGQVRATIIFFHHREPAPPAPDEGELLSCGSVVGGNGGKGVRYTLLPLDVLCYNASSSNR